MRDRPKGLALVRIAKALAAARGDVLLAGNFAAGQGSKWHTETPEVGIFLKSAVAGLSTNDDAALARTRAIGSEFLELVRPQSLIDRIPGMRELPPNTSVLKFGQGAFCRWVGEGQPKPMTRFSLERAVLGFSKLASLIVTSEELVLMSTPEAEAALTTELVRGVAAFSDRAFIDPSMGPIPSVSPGSVTHGAPAIEASGSSTANAQADVDRLFTMFVAGGGMLEAAIIVMHPRSAAAMGRMVVAGGGRVFHSVGARGGDISGVPVMTSSACALSGSPGETFMAIFDPGRILKSDNDAIEVKFGHNATVEMDDTPTGGAVQLVSLWQNNLVGILAERDITWRRADDSAVVVLSGIPY